MQPSRPLQAGANKIKGDLKWKKIIHKKLFDERNEMLGRLENLGYNEMKRLIEIEMSLSDEGFDIESHEDLWLEM